MNNAGTAIPKSFDHTTVEEMDLMFGINVRGTLADNSGGAEAHRKSDGRIINIGSCVGERTMTPDWRR